MCIRDRYQRRVHGQNTYTSHALKTLPSEKCDQCGEFFTLNGPVWLDSLNDIDFIQQMYQDIQSPEFDLKLKTHKKIQGQLHAIIRESQLQNCQPYGFSFKILGNKLRMSQPSKKQIFSGFQSLGYQCVQSYLNPDIYKINCPSTVIFDICREFKCNGKPDQQNELFKNIPKDTPIYLLLSKQNTQKPNLNIENINNSYKDKIGAYLPNPEKNWGPKKKAVEKKLIKTDIICKQITDQQDEELNQQQGDGDGSQKKESNESNIIQNLNDKQKLIQLKNNSSKNKDEDSEDNVEDQELGKLEEINKKQKTNTK
eukprot:TRINITY_DN11265_c0_g1_i5.p1 TRINITY_DN11265_c0_g1~~TRINITY_DN11265_c0_g1_i5.p1  ORF type:complete len:312 (+),score=79.92 TRINITY_DN11265_c0_g1_i5:170-1105(+)